MHYINRLISFQDSCKQRNKAVTTFAYFSTFSALGLVTAVLGPTLLALAEITNTSLSQISILFAVRALGYLLGSIIGGYLYDRMSGHKVMGVMLVGLAFTLVLIPTFTLLWLLSGVLFLTGLLQGIEDVGGNTLLVWVHGRKVGPFMNALHFFYGIGTFIAPIIIAQAVLATGSITGGYWIIAVLVLLPLFPLRSSTSPSIPAKETIGRQNKIDHLLVFLIALFLFCYSAMAHIYGGWLFSYAVELGLTNETFASYLTSTFWGAFTVGRLIAIPIAARFKPSTVLLGDLLGCLLSLGIILLWPFSKTSIWIGTACLGLSLASITPTSISLAESCMEISGNITSRFIIGSSLGAMLPPWIVGQLYESTGPQSMVLSVLALLVATFIVYVLLMREAKPVMRNT